MRLFPLNSRTGASVAGLIVVVSSAYTLLTADRASLNFQFHLALLVAVAVAALVGAGWPRG
jgi:hypothetical protein